LWDGNTIYKPRSIDATNWHIAAFDLNRDPQERINLYDLTNPRHKEIKKKLKAYKKNLIKNYHFGKNAKRKQRVNQHEIIKALKSPGYIK
jgi:hypothetical protein